MIAPYRDPSVAKMLADSRANAKAHEDFHARGTPSWIWGDESIPKGKDARDQMCERIEGHLVQVLEQADCGSVTGPNGGSYTVYVLVTLVRDAN